ncbi:hypothetical protein V6C32_05540 [Desulforamulus ruminis]|uniref:hypothetical protein n=1 Tax=Desulforamulus ruminis TaxID=1564 RepID=UPI002FD8E56C
MTPTKINVIGADGLVLLPDSSVVDVRMKIINSKAGEVRCKLFKGFGLSLAGLDGNSKYKDPPACRLGPLHLYGLSEHM